MTQPLEPWQSAFEQELSLIRTRLDAIHTFLAGGLREQGLVSRVDDLEDDVRRLQAQATQVKSGLWEGIKLALGPIAGALCAWLFNQKH